MRFILTILSAILLFSGTNAESFTTNNDSIESSCPRKIKKWVAKIEKLYAGENLNHIEENEITRIVYNLYYDSYFEPIFGAPFDKIKTRKLKRIDKAGGRADCVDILPGNWGETSSPAKDALGNSIRRRNRDLYSASEVILQVEILREARQKIADAKNGISDWSLNQISSFEKDLFEKYVWLFDHEKNEAQKLIASVKTQKSYQEILSLQQKLIDELNAKKPSFQTLNAIRQFRHQYPDLWNNLDTTQQETVIANFEELEFNTVDRLMLTQLELIGSISDDSYNLSLVEQKENEFSILYSAYSSYESYQNVRKAFQTKKNNILINYTSQWKKRHLSWDKHVRLIQEFNDIQNRYERDFEGYMGYQPVKSLFEDYKQRKTEIVIAHSDYLLNEIESKRWHSALNVFNYQYLRNTRRIPEIIALENALRDKQQEIANSNLAKKRAEQKIRSERRRLVESNNQKIQSQRKILEEEFGTKLPSIEELSEALGQFGNLINRDWQYSRSSGKSFISYIENELQFRRVLQSNINVLEFFLSKNGMNISLHGDFIDDEKYLNSCLEIPNASKEIVDLYKLELATNFRLADKYFSTPEVLPSFPSANYYSHYGYRVYNMDLDSENNLEVCVLRNITGNFKPIFVEQEYYRNLNVSSVSRLTDIELQRGDQLYLRVTVGVNSSRQQIQARIGNGDWFDLEIDPEFEDRIFIVKQDGLLEFRVKTEGMFKFGGVYLVDYRINSD